VPGTANDLYHRTRSLHDAKRLAPATFRGGGFPPPGGALWTLAPEPGTGDGASGADAWLDPVDRERAARIVHAADRIAFVLAHALLHALLERACGLPRGQHRFLRNAHGRPQWAAAPGAPHFSLSHARGLVAVALAPAGLRIGVDAESGIGRASGLWRLARRTCAPAEADWVEDATSDAERQDRFLRLWTLKGALVKASGRGLSLAPDSFVVTVVPPRLVAAVPALQPRTQWRLDSLQPAPGAWVALAVDGPPAPAGALHHVHLDGAALRAALAPAPGEAAG
jgi:4'-phosphopantetheinyl transferase